ncbi:hypothetical protein ANN_27385 [Periplaneta americana]|uniref:Uncharacterized protein n=1 Tax=Periplaneta americana TaxID=6978 RepID=A0ABQ8RVW4_PERAM|nr:hypothetical protein ANN_27385 [Periplaneta americana]
MDSVNNRKSQRKSCVLDEIGTVWQRSSRSSEMFYTEDVKMENISSPCYKEGYNLSIFEELDISQKINKYTRAMGIINSVMKPSLVQKHTRIRLYNTLARPMLSYGSEAWTLRKADKSRITACEISTLQTKIVKQKFTIYKQSLQFTKIVNIVKQAPRRSDLIECTVSHSSNDQNFYYNNVKERKKHDSDSSKKESVCIQSKLQKSIVHMYKELKKEDNEEGIMRTEKATITVIAKLLGGNTRKTRGREGEQGKCKENKGNMNGREYEEKKGNIKTKEREHKRENKYNRKEKKDIERNTRSARGIEAERNTGV